MEPMTKMLTILFIVFCVMLAGLILYWGPVFTIWSLNLLFGLNIVLTWQTWLSMVWLDAMLTQPIANYRGLAYLKKIAGSIKD